MYTNNYNIDPNIINIPYEKNSNSMLSQCRDESDNIQLGSRGSEGGFMEEWSENGPWRKIETKEKNILGNKAEAWRLDTSISSLPRYRDNRINQTQEVSIHFSGYKSILCTKR